LGHTSPPGILEHPKGYLAAFSLEPKPEALTAGLGTTWEILQNGIKFFPSILASHSPIQATLAIVNRVRLDPNDIESITNETYNTVKSHFSNKDVTGTMSARVSVPYCIAVAAVDRVLTQAQFLPDRVADPLVRQVLARTEVVAVPELDRLYPENFPARVTIRMRDGTSHQETVMKPKGDPGNPLTPDEIAAKYRENAAGVLDAAKIESLLAAIRGLPGAADLQGLSALLSPAS
jgi:2-methylcitrate dehydratase PrpD